MYRTLRDDQYEGALAAAGVFILFSLYLLDFSYWTSPAAVAASRFLVVVGVSLIVASLALSAYYFAQAPPTIYMVIVPLFFMGMYRALFRDRSRASYLRSLAASLWIAAAAVFVFFAYRVVSRELWWTDEIRRKYQMEIGCRVTRENGCLAAFLMWYTPVVATVVAFTFGTLCYLLSKSCGKAEFGGVDPRVRGFALTMCAVAMGLWIVVQVAGSARELSAVVMTFSMASFIIAAMLLGSTVGWTNIADELYSVPLFASIVSAATDWGLDVLKAVIISSPAIVFGVMYLAVSALNQSVRRLGFGKPMESEEERASLFTAAAVAQLREMRGWKWTSILTTIHWWIIAVMSLVVLAGTFTVVFLSWVRVALHGSSLLAIYLVFFLVGLAMFLNPFIPGLPVYLTGGILLTGPSFQDAFGGKEAYPRSYALALTVAVFFCFGIKLSAVVMQQKAIGEQLGKRVWVRSLVNVNSITMRAIRRILLTPGLSLAKVCILVGGPDWPVSVTTGILGCDVWQMLLGTTPVLFLIAPSVMAGAFMLKIGDASSSDDICPRIPPSPPPAPPIAAHMDMDMPRINPWESVSQVMSVLTAFAQSAGLLAGAYFIEKVSAKHRASLEAEPPDEDVLRIDEEKRVKKERHARVTEWSVLPSGPRWLLAASAVAITASFWAVLVAPSFLPPETMIKDYVLTDCVSVKLDGKPWTVVTPLGWGFLAVFAVGCVGLWSFGRWARARARQPPDPEKAGGRAEG